MSCRKRLTRARAAPHDRGTMGSKKADGSGAAPRSTTRPPRSAAARRTAAKPAPPEPPLAWQAGAPDFVPPAVAVTQPPSSPV